MNGKRIIFTGERKVELEDCKIESPGGGQLLVQTTASLISAGTEASMLRGTFEEQVTGRSGTFPIRPGYSNAGRILEVGKGVTEFAAGNRVLTMARHAEYASIDIGKTNPDYI